MSIPYYTDIYAFPGGYPSRKPSMKPEILPSYAFDTSKTTDIIDAFGNLRYVVQLSSQLSSIEVSGTTVESRVFQTIVSQKISSDLCAFLTVPEDSYETDYGKAMHDFNVCVERYSSLVWAENKDFNNIDIYSSKIGYKVQKPKCCMNCKWGQKTERNCYHHHAKLECHSPVNQQVFIYSKAFPQLPNPRLHQFRNPGEAWQKLPWQECIPNYGPIPPHEWFLDEIYPIVDPLGVCDHFAEKEDQP